MTSFRLTSIHFRRFADFPTKVIWFDLSPSGSGEIRRGDDDGFWEREPGNVGLLFPVNGNVEFVGRKRADFAP